MTDEMKFPKVLPGKSDYGDNFSKDCVFTHPEAIISLGKQGILDKGLTYLEPACGIGNLSMVLKRNGYSVSSSDILDWGYGEVKPIQDYEEKTHDVVITNPPYSLWELFLARSLEIARHGVFLLMPLRYLEGDKRSRILENTELTAVYVFSYRVKMYKPDGKQLSGMTAYAFFYWNLTRYLDAKRPTEIHWLYR